MINYEIVPLRGQEQFDLNGVRFNGKSFLFWKKKSTDQIKEIIIIFNKKYENMEVRDGVIVLSLKGLTNYNDLRTAIGIFLQIIRENSINVQLHFIIENEVEKNIAEALGKEFGISYVVQNIDQQQNENLQQIEEQINNNANLNMNGDQIINKHDNGILKQITVHNNIAYENNGILNTEEEKVSLLREWMNDPIKSRELINMSEEARDELLTKAVMSNKKEYRLEKANEQLANDKVGEVAINAADREGGLVNNELGIVQNDVSNINKYSAVEKNGDNVQVVNPNVVSTNISTNSGVSSSATSSSEANGVEQVNTEKKEEQQRDVSDQIYYIDEERNILNNDGEVIGKLGVDGYTINYEDNSLLKFDQFGHTQVIGYIGDYKDMGRGNENIYSKPNVRTLKKEIDNKSSGFAALPVIMFVLSALLFIGALIFLFVLE